MVALADSSRSATAAAAPVCGNNAQEDSARRPTAAPPPAEDTAADTFEASSRRATAAGAPLGRIDALVDSTRRPVDVASSVGSVSGRARGELLLLPRDTEPPLADPRRSCSRTVRRRLRNRPHFADRCPLAGGDDLSDSIPANSANSAALTVAPISLDKTLATAFATALGDASGATPPPPSAPAPPPSTSPSDTTSDGSSRSAADSSSRDTRPSPSTFIVANSPRNRPKFDLTAPHRDDVELLGLDSWAASDTGDSCGAIGEPRTEPPASSPLALLELFRANAVGAPETTSRCFCSSTRRTRSRSKPHFDGAPPGKTDGTRPMPANSANPATVTSGSISLEITAATASATAAGEAY